MSDRITLFARRLREDRYFLSSAMQDYASSERLDGARLAVVLGCGVDDLGPLGLCRRPRPGPDTFGDDVQRIARRFGVSADRLAEMVRRSDALIALRDAESEDVMAAARDRPPRESPRDDESP